MKFFLVKCDDHPLALSMMHPEEKAGWRQAKRADCFSTLEGLFPQAELPFGRLS